MADRKKAQLQQHFAIAIIQINGGVEPGVNVPQRLPQAPLQVHRHLVVVMVTACHIVNLVHYLL